jgi:hypothetical protein
MNYNKLIFHEDTWPDVVGRTLTFNCKRYELELKTIEGIRSCSITMAECIAFRSRFELSHIDTWAAEYHHSFGAVVLDGNSWYLKLYNGRKLFKETHGCNGLPPSLQWNTFYSVVARMCTIAQVRGILRPDEAMERPCF